MCSNTATVFAGTRSANPIWASGLCTAASTGRTYDRKQPIACRFSLAARGPSTYASFDMALRAKLSDCVAGQAACHGFWSRRMALRMVSSLRMQATMATILGFPWSSSLWRKARMMGL